MRSVLAIVGVALAGCGAGSADVHNNNDGGIGDAGNGCGINLIFEPAMPVAGDHVKVTAEVFTAGVLDYHWQVDGVDTMNYEAADKSAIGFDVPTAVSHTVTVDVTPANGCAQEQRTINVGTGGAFTMYRMRVIPPASAAPPQETLILVQSGASADRPFFIDPGTVLNGTVKASGVPVAAYLKFIPTLGPAFDIVTGTGTFAVHAQLQAHAVIVIPQDNTLAPRVIAWMPGSPSTFTVDAGTAVTGTVLDRGGAPLANAQVQLEQHGVPSTIATTAANGTFTLRTSFSAGQMTKATITPPPTSGLPRLTATAMYDLTQAMQVSYALSPQTCDLATTPIKRGGTNQAGAIVTIAGSLAGTVGTVTTGATVGNATGTVHVTATAGGGGLLPTALVPRASLSAIVQLGANDYAVAALDTSACTIAPLDAPARITVTGSVTDPATVALVGARVEAIPVGALALANLIPVQATTTAGGAFSLQLASGGHYDVRFVDPGGRGSPREFPDVTAAGVPTTPQALAPAIALTGEVSVINDPNVIEGASVLLLCANCTGLAASQPIAQTATDITGTYRVAVPDPGM